MTDILHAVFLGILEGLTEFLPVSSTGHLILFVDLLGFQGPPGRVFEVAIQLGAVLAICALYWRKLWNVTINLPTSAASRLFAANILIAFLPAMVLGALFHSYIKEVLFDPQVVCIALIVGGIALLVLERVLNKPHIHRVDDLPLPSAFKIGVVQCLAMVPGVSRSGATIMGGLLLGLDKRTAAEFSFFLAIPTMAGAVAYDLYKNWEHLVFDDWQVIAIGFITAFLAALAVVQFMLRLITRWGFAPFAIYRIILGAVMLTLI
ncbi:MAG: undecaprenyl-diphosphate phosphatase [Bdellovibrionales bacterium]